jgi:DNA invertase Pin-like site-specific DNA recombinase
VLVWKLDRLGRNLRHLITTIEEITDRGVTFASLGEGIDSTSSAGRMMIGLLGSFAQFERERIRERIHLGLDRARKEGKKLGRRVRREGEPLTVRQAALLWNCSKSQAARRIARCERPTVSAA